jgi:hypothetical protein
MISASRLGKVRQQKDQCKGVVNNLPPPQTWGEGGRGGHLNGGGAHTKVIISSVRSWPEMGRHCIAPQIIRTRPSYSCAHTKFMYINPFCRGTWRDRGQVQGRLQGMVQGRLQGSGQGRLQGMVQGRLQGSGQGRLQNKGLGRLQGRGQGRLQPYRAGYRAGNRVADRAGYRVGCRAGYRVVVTGYRLQNKGLGRLHGRGLHEQWACYREEQKAGYRVR